jgi:hypothetical protein
MKNLSALGKVPTRKQSRSALGEAFSKSLLILYIKEVERAIFGLIVFMRKRHDDVPIHPRLQLQRFQGSICVELFSYERFQHHTRTSLPNLSLN